MSGYSHMRIALIEIAARALLIRQIEFKELSKLTLRILSVIGLGPSEENEAATGAGKSFWV